MPFQSEKQRRYLWANEPKIARDWADTYGSRIKKDDGGITDITFSRVQPSKDGSRPGYFTRAQEETSQGKAMSPGTSAGGRGGSGGSPHGRDPSGPKGDMTTRDYKPTKGDYRDRKIKEEFIQKSKKEKPPLTFKDKFKQTGSNYRKKELRKLFDHIYGGRKMQLPSMSALTRKADWDDEDYLSWDPTGASLHGDMSGKDLQKLRDLQTALGQGSLSQTGKFKGDNQFAFEDFYPNVNQQSAGGGGGDGQGGGYMGYPSYEAWKAAQGSQGTGATAAAPISAFQQSLAGGPTSSFDYYVGKDPSAKNLAWGKQMGVDPRTMGLTSFAADGGRIPAAFGGIMDSSTGRRAYGFGSIFKKIGRAAKKVLKSPIGKGALLGLGAYGLGGGRFGIGGAQFSMKNLRGAHGIKQLLTKKGAGNAWDWGKLAIAGSSALPFFMGGEKDKEDEGFDYEGAKNAYADEIMRLRKGVKGGNLTDEATQAFLPVNYGQAEGGRIGYYAGGQSTPSDYTMEDAMMTTTQDKLGGITDVMKQADLNRQGSVGQFYAANGGSADAKLLARVQELQDEGLDYNSAMAQALKELSSGKAQGGRIGYAGGSGRPPVTMGQAPQVPPQMPAQPPQPPQRPNPMPAPQPNRMGGMPGGMNPMMGGMPGGMNPMMNRPMMNPMMRGMPAKRIGRQEGGLMDLGGMEKDYRNDGGFVPLGGEEKADDVPARLSKNEFVFTADAVRGAGDGDIDKGAEIMENIMKNLEQGGQISEETQGLSGAQEMFGVSERLSEVV